MGAFVLSAHPSPGATSIYQWRGGRLAAGGCGGGGAPRSFSSHAWSVVKRKPRKKEKYPYPYRPQEGKEQGRALVYSVIGGARFVNGTDIF